MKAHRGSEGIAPLIPNPNTNGGEWLTSRPGRFTIGKKPLNRRAGRAPKSRLHILENRSISCPCWGWKLDKDFFFYYVFDLQITTPQMLPRVTRKGSARWDNFGNGVHENSGTLYGGSVAPEWLDKSNLCYTFPCFKLYRSIKGYFTVNNLTSTPLTR